MIKNVLLINSYGGSLNLAAHQLKLNVIGSLENNGYGIDIQRANFPKVEYYPTTETWNKVFDGERQDLKDTIVFAHPPCKVFSVQAGAARKGTDAAAFQDTVDAITYGLENGCLAMAVESVQAACEGAREVHDQLAKDHGYDLYRVFQNAVTFGIPQWRPRFWAIFVRKGLVKDMTFAQTYRFKSIGTMLEEQEPVDYVEEFDPKILEQVSIQRDKLKAKGLTPRVIDEILEGEDYGYLAAILKRYLGSEDTVFQVAKDWCHKGSYLCSSMRLLDPEKPAVTLLYDSWWWYKTRIPTIPEMKAIMGFPRNYIFPGRYATKYREYLSRGVCPPVAVWLWKNIVANLNGKPLRGKVEWPCAPGQIADFNVKKKEITYE